MIFVIYSREIWKCYEVSIALATPAAYLRVTVRHSSVWVNRRPSGVYREELKLDTEPMDFSGVFAKISILPILNGDFRVMPS